MAKNLEEIMGFENMLGMFSDPRGDVPADFIPPSFLPGAGNTRNVFGDAASYFRVKGNRQTAKLVQYGSPSTAVEIKGVDKVPVTLMHTAENYKHGLTVLESLRDFDSPARQEWGRSELARRNRQLRARVNNLRVSAMMSLWRHGKIFFDSAGNLLPSSSSASTTVDSGINTTTNTDACQDIGGTAIRTADWSTAGTKITTQIKTVKETALKRTGYPIRNAWYGAGILGFLLGNTELTKVIQGNPTIATGFASGEIPNGFLGLNWIPIYGSFFEDADGSLQDWFPDDYVVFTPDASPDWWEWILGSYPVPTSLQPTDSPEAATSNIRRVFGMFSYSRILDDPPRIKQVGGDTFLPTLKVPDAIYIMDTVD
ncbi:hypothetical protein LCGC14_1554050 [marine sediment metagenome]|uniref:Uncharacterized protein n=1 Tax=marine sediment metagenome TaxID=412755 RepID=A0A0F9IPG8_9ZZZZ